VVFVSVCVYFWWLVAISLFIFVIFCCISSFCLCFYLFLLLLELGRGLVTVTAAGVCYYLFRSEADFFYLILWGLHVTRDLKTVYLFYLNYLRVNLAKKGNWDGGWLGSRERSDLRVAAYLLVAWNNLFGYVLCLERTNVGYAFRASGI
jgi:hypothetical protein